MALVCITLRRRHAFPQLRYWRITAETLFDARLQIGHVTGFFVQNWRRNKAPLDMIVDLVLQADVNLWGGDDHE